MNNNSIPHVVRAILEIEAPISEEWLLKRIVHIFNRQKVTNVVKQEFYVRMRGWPSVEIQRSNGFLFLKDKKIPMLRVPNNDETPREICYVAPQELALGIKEILEQNVTAEKSGLFKLIAQHLGFNRLGESILAHMEIALGLLAKDVNIDGEILSIKKQ